MAAAQKRPDESRPQRAASATAAVTAGGASTPAVSRHSRRRRFVVRRNPAGVGVAASPSAFHGAASSADACAGTVTTAVGSTPASPSTAASTTSVSRSF